MEGLIDDTRLEGSHRATVSLRPPRIAETVGRASDPTLAEHVRLLCQRWGGAGAPLIPVDPDGNIDEVYQAILAGSDIDQVRGLSQKGLRAKPLPAIKPPVDSTRYEYGTQLAVGMFGYQRQNKYFPLSIAQLAEDDPWADIYRAVLGDLPDDIDPVIIDQVHYRPDLRFDDYLRVERQHVTGSLEDLIARAQDPEKLTPRRASMVDLNYGGLQSTSLRSGVHAIPEPRWAVADGGSNVIVVCSPGDVRDVALLWNLRTAHGDLYALPIGVPRHEFNSTQLARFNNDVRRETNGIPRQQFYVTSATIPPQDLREMAGDTAIPIAFVEPSEVLTFGWAASWNRTDILLWRDGESTFVPTADDRFLRRRRAGRLSNRVELVVGVQVPDAPFPNAPDIRVHAQNGQFFAGALTHTANSRNHEPLTVQWPSTMLTLRSLLRSRDLDAAPSEPGLAGTVVLNQLDSFWELNNFAHAPLLELLAAMASHSGISWAREKVREIGREGIEVRGVPTDADDLSERPFSSFQKALGESRPAAKNWLTWAEQRGFVVKGFPIACSRCGSKQWTPVNAFNPPIICRGCAQPIQYPFDGRDNVYFKWRLSERLRRLYEHDAMGHLLAIRFFGGALQLGRGSRLTGVHPGLNLRRPGKSAVVAEADVTLLLNSGDIVPIEVKRNANHLGQDETAKLDAIRHELGAPWSAIATCQWAKDVPDSFHALEQLLSNAVPRPRFTLTYDHLLDPHPFWRLGGNPFAWNPITADAIKKREEGFVNRMRESATQRYDWLEDAMLSSFDGDTEQ